MAVVAAATFVVMLELEMESAGEAGKEQKEQVLHAQNGQCMLRNVSLQ